MGRWHLFPKYAALIIALVGGTLVATIAVASYFSYGEILDHLSALQAEKAQGAANRIEQYAAGIQQQLAWTELPPTGTTGNRLDARRIEYIKLLRQVPALTEVAWLDANGKEQLRVSRVAMDAVSSGADRSQQAGFHGANAGQVQYGEVYFRKETEPYMSIYRPAGRVEATPEGQLRSLDGVTVAEVNLKFVWDVVSRIRIGRTGLAYVVDSGGTLIAHPDMNLVLRKTDMRSLPQVAALSQQEQQQPLARNLEGGEVFSAHAAIPTLHWAVLVESPRAEVLAPLYASILRMGVVLAAGLLIATVASFLLARALVRPLRALQAGAERIGRGELDQRIEVHTGDEIEGVAEQFNKMGAQLKASYSGLERQVRERTAQLERATHELEEWSRCLEQRVQEGVNEVEKLSRMKRFLSPQIAEVVMTAGSSLKTHRAEITVVFLDIRGFTSFTESADPEEVLQVLREYHAEMGRLIMAFRGTLERFAGDGIMVFFNDPLPLDNPAEQAVRMCVEMQSSFAGLKRMWGRRGHELEMGIGIAQGFATLGVIGFEGRQDYGAIGPVCNLASRLCDEARGGQILVSQKVMGCIEGVVLAQRVADVNLKGVHKPVTAFNVTGLG